MIFHISASTNFKNFSKKFFCIGCFFPAPLGSAKITKTEVFTNYLQLIFLFLYLSPDIQLLLCDSSDIFSHLRSVKSFTFFLVKPRMSKTIALRAFYLFSQYLNSFFCNFVRYLWENRILKNLLHHCVSAPLGCIFPADCIIRR